MRCAVFAVLAASALCAGALDAQRPSTGHIPYTIASEHRNPAGYVRAIVVAAGYRDEADLRLLATELQELALRDPWAIYAVFDNARAAKLFGDASGDPQPGDFYDRHLVMTFNKNASEAEFVITLHGSNGPQIDIDAR